MRIKALTVHCAIITILVYSFLIGYTSVAGPPSYADDSIEWENCTTATEQAEAFKAYCKSRDLTIEGSIADGVTSFTTQTYQTLVNTLGIDINALQADIKKATDSNGAVKYLFNASGISAMNRIFSQFLQDHDYEVGDEIDNDTLYDGEYFVDDDGNYCLIYISSSYNFSYSDYNSNNPIVQLGTNYKYDFTDFRDLFENAAYNEVKSVSFNINDTVYNASYKCQYDTNVQINIFPSNLTNTSCIIYKIGRLSSSEQMKLQYYGGCCIVKVGTKYYLANESLKVSDKSRSIRQISILNGTDLNFQPVNVFVYSPTINNNNYNNNTYTTINNDGDVYNYDTDEEPDPDDNPSGGGGNDTTTPPTDTGGGDGEDDTTITFPDFDFNFPEINWSIGDLSNKFPFSIPFDLVAFFTVLNAEPRAPAIDAEIPLGSFYTWHFEADFSQFDNYAVIVRNVEFIAFVIGLIYLTIKLVRG